MVPWWSFWSEDVGGAFYLEARPNVKVLCKNVEKAAPAIRISPVALQLREDAVAACR
jgi:hypothetical protein